MDEKAAWKDDKLFPPSQVDLGRIPTNEPTAGWGILESAGKPCKVPVTTEEMFSAGDNKWRYHGVTWVSTNLEIPESWKGRHLTLHVSKARLRAEVYWDGKLIGYDLVGDSPFEVELPGSLGKHQLAFRLTNPGGNRGWEDQIGIRWGTYAFPASHDFTGLGEVHLVATGESAISCLHVLNQLPADANCIRANATIENRSQKPVRGSLEISIRELNTECELARQSVSGIEVSGSREIGVDLSGANALPWSPETPKLYRCVARWADENGIDEVSERFGFRVFEVREPEGGQPHYYLNGARFRHRSAIDWGYYALTGWYATPEHARRSVASAKAIGHNGLNFHRLIGEPLVLKEADEQGLVTYEEPGGFHEGGQGYSVTKSGPFAMELMKEKCRRMVQRDFNHPSLAIYVLCNEDPIWSPLRQEVTRMIHAMDPSRMVVNVSGSDEGKPDSQWDRAVNNDGPTFLKRELWTPHMRPYSSTLGMNYVDKHNANSTGPRFVESDLFNPRFTATFPGSMYYLGEVIATTGPSNWVKIADDNAQRPKDTPGYDWSAYKDNALTLQHAFTDFQLAKAGSKIIQSPQDITAQAGRGLMYKHGRHEQAILANDFTDGFAMNGWSPGPYSEGGNSDWDSAIVDGGRNLKGPASDLAYWNRPLQIVIRRKNGKYFKPGETAKFSIALVNENQLAGGDYTMILHARDGAGAVVNWEQSIPLKVAGGAVFAQEIPGGIQLPISSDWSGGYLTVEAVMLRGNDPVANGAEQVLLQNRPAFARALAGKRIAVFGWPGAGKALADAGVEPITCGGATAPSLICLGSGATEEELSAVLAAAKSGSRLLVNFDENLARRLLERKILSAPVTQWGGLQTPHLWASNGWGYIDYFNGGRAVPSGFTVSTNSWEVPGDPRGFFPFESNFPRKAFGLYMARPWTARAPATKAADTPPTLLVLIGAIEYGKGLILLSPSYPVDDNNAWNDLLFFNELIL